MATNWIQCRLKDVCMGIFDGPHATPSKTDSGPIFLGISALTNGRLDLAQVEHLSEHDYRRWTKRVIPQEGDVVFSYETRIGEAALIPSGLRCCLGRRMGLMRPDTSKVHPRYLLYYYLSSSFQEFLSSHTMHGSTVDRILLTDFPEFPITLPPMNEQKAIAHILGTLDDKIELNRRMNETLEAMARALFKSWFVDFDPVHAKADAKRHGSSPDAALAKLGVTPAVAPLFPDSFTDSPLGPIPTGWEVGSISDLARFVNGRNFTKDATGTGRMVIRIAELNSGPGGSTVYNDVAAEADNTAYPDDILFAWSGSLDVYRWHGPEAIINQHIFKVVCEDFPKWFVYYHLVEAMPFFKGIAAHKATTMGHIKRGHLDEVKLALPSKDVLARVSHYMDPLYSLINSNEAQSNTLAIQRDSLLPALMSGTLLPARSIMHLQEGIG